MTSRLALYVRVKFRIFGITFGTFEKALTYDLPLFVPNHEHKQILQIDERGVYVTVTLAAIEV